MIFFQILLLFAALLPTFEVFNNWYWQLKWNAFSLHHIRKMVLQVMYFHFSFTLCLRSFCIIFYETLLMRLWNKFNLVSGYEACDLSCQLRVRFNCSCSFIIRIVAFYRRLLNLDDSNLLETRVTFNIFMQSTLNLYVIATHLGFYLPSEPIIAASGRYLVTYDYYRGYTYWV